MPATPLSLNASLSLSLFLSLSLSLSRHNWQVMNARDVAAPNVSVGIYILNLGQESSAGVGIGSGVFFADFLLYLRQRDRPLRTFSWGNAQDPMDQLSFSNAKSIMKVSIFRSLSLPKKPYKHGYTQKKETQKRHLLT